MQLANTSDCRPAVYTGLVCQPALQSYQDSLLRNASSQQVFIASDVDQEAIEAQSFQVLANLTELEPNITAECERLLTEFLCIHMFGLCVDNETLYLPSAEQCRIVQDMCVPELLTYTATLGVPVNCTGEL